LTSASASAKRKAACARRQHHATAARWRQGARGHVNAVDNLKIAKLAKLAGAPDDKAAGVDLHVGLGDVVSAGQPVCTVHADSPGELAYAFDYAAANPGIFTIDEP